MRDIKLLSDLKIQQTDSSFSYVRGYGCYSLDIAAGAFLLAQKEPSIAEFDTYVTKGIAKGFILNNDIPIKAADRAKWSKDHGGKPCPEWYRMYVVDSYGWMKLVAAELGIKITVSEIDPKTNLPFTKRINEAITTSKANFFMFEHADQWGSHFTTAEIKDGNLVEAYDPGKSYARYPQLRSIRYMVITKI